KQKVLRPPCQHRGRKGEVLIDHNLQNMCARGWRILQYRSCDMEMLVVYRKPGVPRGQAIENNESFSQTRELAFNRSVDT
ncbi:hypothetical protein J6590_068360, partial [Homalodisca vitripennis]